ncbi:MAG: PCMD domain-containing protein [Muribaculaceae bacterium]|nr:PCMD domain-containing protein [Muribaculaceae bacterium]
MKSGIILTSLLIAFQFMFAQARKVEMLPYGDFNNWVTRQIKESSVLGGKQKECFAVGPTKKIVGSRPYVSTGGSPWASSNVMAKVAGVTKVSNAVFPDERSAGNKCARLTTMIEQCKVLGLVNLDVLVAGTLFLGKMNEPIRSTTNPYSKMEMGVPFTKRPVAMSYDYRLDIPADGEITYSSGFGSKRTSPGTDKAEAFILLQRRWEDEQGNIFAKRVGTGRELLGRQTDGWVNGHTLEINYGDISGKPFYKKRMGLIPESKSYYARNSKGKMVPVKEVGWDSEDAVPTHIIVMFSSGSGDPYTGTVGMTFWVDNVALVY